MTRSPSVIEELIEAFESAWNEAPPACLRDFARNQPTEALVELVLVDLERRYRSRRGTLTDELGHQPRVEDYVRLIDRFNGRTARTSESIPITPELVSEEYRVRTIWGDRPSHKHFLPRFDNLCSTDLLSALRRVDTELLIEQPHRQNTSKPFDPRAPLRYEDFEILQMVGAGSNGKVYRCRQKSLDRIVALKSLHRKLVAHDWAIDSFLREGRILAQLNHPNILKLYGAGRFPNGGYFLATEWVNGMNLRQWLNRDAASENRFEAKRILIGIIDAVAHAHANRIVHCDLKPENILLGDDRIVVADFGMASFIQPETDDRPVGPSIGGTRRYLAPEAWSGAITPAADVFSIGVIVDEVASSIEGNHVRAALTELAEACRSQDSAQRPTLQNCRDVLATI